MIHIPVGFVDEPHENGVHTPVSWCGREGVFDTIYQFLKRAMKLEGVVVSNCLRPRRNTVTASHAKARALCGSASPVSSGERIPTESAEP